MLKLSNVDIRKKEYEAKKQDAEFRLKKYKEYGVEEKLQKQVDFESDSRKIALILGFIQTYLDELSELINCFEDDLKNYKIYKSKQNTKYFADFFAVYDKILTAFDSVKTGFDDGLAGLNELKEKQSEFEKIKKGLKEEFAEVERSLATELKATGVQAIRSDEFLSLKKIAEQAKLMLKTLNHQETQKSDIDKQLITATSKLNELWHEELNAGYRDKAFKKKSLTILRILTGCCPNILQP